MRKTVWTGAVLALTWLALGGVARTEQPKKPLELTLSCDKKEYSTKERPKFAASIKNVSDAEVHVAGCLDGSSRGRYPRFIAEATLDGEAVAEEEIGFCGNKNSLRVDDVKKLKPGESLDPFGKGCFRQHQLERTFKFDKPGTYKVTLVYDSDPDDVKKFYGDGADADARAACEKLVRTRVESKVLTFTVK